MMDIATQAEIVLREAGYETWPWSGASPPVICFENSTAVGFLHVFGSAQALLDGWEQAQTQVLARHTAPLRASGLKAWNVYSVFLTSERTDTLRRSIERLEEDFVQTRKIARSGIQLVEDLEHALLPLVPIKASPHLGQVSVEERLRLRSADLPDSALNAFLGTADAGEVADMLNVRS